MNSVFSCIISCIIKVLQEKSDLLQTKRNRNGQKVRRSAPTEK